MLVGLLIISTIIITTLFYLSINKFYYKRITSKEEQINNIISLTKS